MTERSSNRRTKREKTGRKKNISNYVAPKALSLQVMVPFAGPFVSKPDKLIIFYHKATIFKAHTRKEKNFKQSAIAIEHIGSNIYVHNWFMEHCKNAKLLVAALSDEVISPLRRICTKLKKYVYVHAVPNANFWAWKKRAFVRIINWLQHNVFAQFVMPFVSFVSTVGAYVMLQSTQYHQMNWEWKVNHMVVSHARLYLYKMFWCSNSSGSTNESIVSPTWHSRNEMKTNFSCFYWVTLMQRSYSVAFCCTSTNFEVRQSKSINICTFVSCTVAADKTEFKFSTKYISFQKQYFQSHFCHRFVEELVLFAECNFSS